ncbi:hypothetical protein [Azospirillum sp. ST 5-10]|uniref:hypothetical protein n=1 Tax=unclassified Azospirillum TaxID=2630922 RepID=UPI003F4A5500
MTANENERFEQFAAVLQTELLERTKKTMELLVPEKEPCARLPFAQTPSFFDIYSEVVRVGIFPVVLSRRPVRAIVGDVDWAREGREYLLSVLDDRTNAVFTSWDYAWDALWDERKAPASTSAQPERRRGFLGSLFGRRGQPKPESRPANEEGAVMEGLYSMLNRLSDKKGYLPLFHDDLRVFKALVRVKPARVLAASKELAQYHRQEFEMTGHDQAKTGVLSDALQKWQFNLPDRIGEFLVVKAAVDFEHVNKQFIGKFIRQSARTQEEAERGMPYLTLYWKAMSNAVLVQE